MPVENLEHALHTVEREIDEATKSVLAALREIKRAKEAASKGQLRDLRQALSECARLAAESVEVASGVRDGWVFDEQRHFSSGAFTNEVLTLAKAEGVNVYELDGRILSYPAIVAVSATDVSVLVDKKRDRRVRPSVLVKTLRGLQSKSPRFKPEGFLDALCRAYDMVLAKNAQRAGSVAKLVDVYEVLTLLPGSARDYSKQEFARDLYLLDQSGVTATREGRVITFPASALTRGAGGLSTVTRSGQEKLYVGVQFSVAP